MISNLVLNCAVPFTVRAGDDQKKKRSGPAFVLEVPWWDFSWVLKNG